MITAQKIRNAYQNIRPVIKKTPLQYHARLSDRYGCSVYLKREDLQKTRSYKLRGAYHFISTLSPEEKRRGIVCASAGNHAQGVAYTCEALGIKGTIFMPKTTPRQKIERTRQYGKNQVEIRLEGDNFDECCKQAKAYAQQGKIFVHPFDEERIIEGQGTVGLEIADELADADIIFVPVGGGGLISGVASYVKETIRGCTVIGVEPAGAASMRASLDAKKIVTLQNIDTFVDGASVRRVAEQTFRLVRKLVNGLITVEEGAVCSQLLDLYTQDAIVAEPAGVLSLCGLEQCRERIKAKKVVCIISGGNNDIDRLAEIKERSLLHEGLKHYFIIRFAQRPGALREFLEVLGENDDIVRFEYLKKNEKESGPALVGIVLGCKEEHPRILHRMQERKIDYTEVKGTLYDYLI